MDATYTKRKKKLEYYLLEQIYNYFLEKEKNKVFKISHQYAHAASVAMNHLVFVAYRKAMEKDAHCFCFGVAFEF